MNALKEVDELLSRAALDPDGWFDYYQEVAISKAKEFTEEEWNKIAGMWKNKEEGWQSMLAGMLGSSNPAKTVPILEEMVMTATPEVVSEALNSLEGMDGGDGYMYVPGENMIRQMKKIYAYEQNPIHKGTIESLQSRAK